MERVLRRGGHRQRLFLGRIAIARGEMRMHPGASRMRVDLDEQLPDHLSAQPLANGRQLAGRARGAALASQSHFKTKLRVIVLRRGVHGRNIISPDCSGTKGFEEGFGRLV